MLLPARSDAAVAARTLKAPRVTAVSTETWILAVLVVIGAALRFATLTTQSFWFDEAQASLELHRSFGAMLHAMSARETNPPLYFVIGWLWSRPFGTGEAGLRSLSALAGTAAIPIGYLCARELVSRRAGLVTAALVAVSPFMLWYSQEAREYMLLAALSGASLLYFAKARRKPSTENATLWAAFSALALLTHFFATFLVAAEAVWLVYVVRSRAIVIAVGAVSLAEAALLPLLFTHATNSLLGFIKSTPLTIRLQQVPVAFGLGTLYQSSLVNDGLLAAAVLAAVLIVLLVIGAGGRELRGAGTAAALAGCVVLVPLAFALFGEDYYIVRALMPAWIPLVVVIAAASTAQRARLPGAVLVMIVLAGFIYAQVRISDSPQYQRPDWRGVAHALGKATGARAIVAYDGTFAVDPLAIYLARVPWPGASTAPVTVAEVDVVGRIFQTSPARLPPGTKLLARTAVDGFLVDRFSVAPAWSLTPAAIGARAAALLGPAPAAPAVLVQGAA
jgi:mannosyltransferase